jgi:hypothetical protein
LFVFIFFTTPGRKTSVQTTPQPRIPSPRTPSAALKKRLLANTNASHPYTYFIVGKKAAKKIRARVRA